MASKELIEKLVRAMLDAERKSMDLPHRIFHTPADRESVAPMAQAAISTILAALQEPTGEMLKSGQSFYTGSKPFQIKHWRAMLNASALGEQSE